MGKITLLRPFIGLAHSGLLTGIIKDPLGYVDLFWAFLLSTLSGEKSK